MEKKGKLRIKIEFVQTNGQTVSRETTIDLLDSDLDNIDICEQKLLSSSYETMRSALSAHFSEASKKKKRVKYQPKTTK